MMNCKPARRNETTPCFRCIRNVPASIKYDFVYECIEDVMNKMDEDELKTFSDDVLRAVLAVDTFITDFEELTLLGDCLARVYMFTLTRTGTLKGIFNEHFNVEEVLRIAAEKSMVAWGIVSMYEKDVPMPECWLEKTRS